MIWPLGGIGRHDGFKLRCLWRESSSLSAATIKKDVTIKVYGPYTRKDGRKHVIKIDGIGNRTTQSYPRYLLEQHLGRELLKEETVDHIDENYTNNKIENLQLLSRADNIRKSAKGRSMYTFICPICGTEATKPTNHVLGNRRKGKAGPFCSRKCAGIYSTTK